MLLSHSADQHQSQIYNGELADEAELDGVVSLMSDLGNGTFASYCSGTLIAEDLVLTAAHCLFGGYVYVGAEPPEPVPLAQMAAQQVALFEHVDYAGVGSVTDDIGLVKIDPPITDVEPFLPLPPNLALTEDDLGGDLLFVGYGLRNDHYDQGNSAIPVTRQKIGLPLLDFCEGDQCTSNSVDDNELIYFHALDDETGAGPCQGDSGGPAFVTREVNGQDHLFVAGVASTINNADCPQATRGHHTYMAGDHYPWLLNALKEQGLTLPICELGIDNCDPTDPCVFDPTETLGYKCGGCPAGYDDVADECVDIDECARETDNCSGEETCVNIPGYFQCQSDSEAGEDTKGPEEDDNNQEDDEPKVTESSSLCAASAPPSGDLSVLVFMLGLAAIATRRGDRADEVEQQD